MLDVCDVSTPAEASLSLGETGEGGAVANPLSTHTLFHTNMQQNWTGGLQAGGEKCY